MLQKPHIIVIPQNMLSEQSKNFLKQRQVFANSTTTVGGRPVKPIAAVMGHTRPTVVTTAAAATLPTTMTLKRPISPYKPAFSAATTMEVEVKEEEDDDLLSYSKAEADAGPPKKRANLDHLSAEERLMRRKLKNRVAAQTARDKKKAYIDEMEEILARVKQQLKQAVDEKTRLQENNATLQLENASLLQRNRDLQARLGLTATAAGAEDDDLTILTPPRAEYTLPLSPAASPLPPVHLPASPPCSPTIMSTSVGNNNNNVAPTTTAAVAVAAAVDGAVATPPEPAVLNDPLQQETGVATAQQQQQQQQQQRSQQQPDRELSSNDLTTWSSRCALWMFTWSTVLLSLKNSNSSSSSRPPTSSSPPPPLTLCPSYRPWSPQSPASSPSPTTCRSSMTLSPATPPPPPPPLLTSAVPLKKRGVKWHTMRTLKSPPPLD